MSAAPDIYRLVDDEELKHFNAVDDCLAQCAATFGGGINAYGAYNMLELIRWTDRAIQVTQGGEEDG